MLEEKDGEYVRYSDVDRLTAAAPEMIDNMGTAYEMIMAGQHYAAAVLLKNAIAKAEGRVHE
jgi:hypothetical protein